MSKKKPAEELPIRVVSRKGKGEEHDTEERVFAREIHEFYCNDKKCRFYGQRSVQGVCHTTKPWLPGNQAHPWAVVDQAEKEAEALIEDAREMYAGKPRKDYIAYLESHIICSEMNTIFTLDELIRLRSKNAIMAHDLKKIEDQWKGKKAPPKKKPRRSV